MKSTDFKAKEILDIDMSDDSRPYRNVFLTHRVEYLGNKGNKDIAVIAVADFDADIHIDGVGHAMFDEEENRIAVILKHDNGLESVLLFPEMVIEPHSPFESFFQNVRNVYEHGAMAFCARTDSGEVVTLPID